MAVGDRSTTGAGGFGLAARTCAISRRWIKGSRASVWRLAMRWDFACGRTVPRICIGGCCGFPPNFARSRRRSIMRISAAIRSATSSSTMQTKVRRAQWQWLRASAHHHGPRWCENFAQHKSPHEQLRVAQECQRLQFRVLIHPSFSRPARALWPVQLSFACRCPRSRSSFDSSP